MLDLTDAPAFLIQHLVVHHAADGELGVFLDGVVLEVLVAAVAVERDNATPDNAGELLGTSAAPSSRTPRRAACSPRGRAPFRTRRGRSTRRGSPRERTTVPARRGTRAPARRSGPSAFSTNAFEPRRATSRAEASRDTSAGTPIRCRCHRKTHADGFRPCRRCGSATSRSRSASAPIYRRPISSRSAGSDVALRREEPRVDRIRIRAADERQLDDVVRRDHPGVARMKLRREAVGVSASMQGVDAVGDVQRRALVPLGQEVPQRPIDRARHAHRDALGGHQGERPVDRAYRRRITVITRRRASSRSTFVNVLSDGSRRSTHAKPGTLEMTR